MIYFLSHYDLNVNNLNLTLIINNISSQIMIYFLSHHDLNVNNLNF